ncbi:MAG: pre-peptidase C-terminal domain-containing protein [Anaerolineae bacterium]|nr:pre-peptidase C-terminal domain-containing protein [Anaerolineae bacterium]
MMKIKWYQYIPFRIRLLVVMFFVILIILKSFNSINVPSADVGTASLFFSAGIAHAESSISGPINLGTFLPQLVEQTDDLGKNTSVYTDALNYPMEATCGPFIDPETNAYLCYTYGNCTWWAAYKRSGVGIDSWGDAGNWYGEAEGADYMVCSEAKGKPCPRVVGATAWWASGEKMKRGHVAHVENSVPLLVSEMSYGQTPLNYPKENPTVWVNLLGDSIVIGDPDGYIYGFRGDPVVLFNEIGYIGSSYTYLDPPRTIVNLPSLINDQASSVSIKYGWAIKLYEHVDGGGGCLLLDADDFDLSDNFFNNGQIVNNSVSSIQVFKDVCPAPCPNVGTYSNSSNNVQTPTPGICGIPIVPDKDSLIEVNESPSNGIILPPNQSFVKIWRVRNSGTTTWVSGYELVFVSGNQMGAPGAVSIPAASPGQEVNLSVNMVAPSSTGSHTGYWRLRNPQGTFFGPTLFVKINVQTTSSYITVFSTDPPSPADTSSVQIRVKVEGFPNLRATRLLIDSENKYELGGPEFIYTWNTGGYAAGDHSIVVEVADQTDTSWSHPERRAITYRLLGTGATPNHAPYRPTPTSPYDWYVYYSGNTAQLCAQANGDPDGDAITAYYFDIYDSAELWNSGWVAGNCVTTAALGPYTYQWRVKVRDSLGAESEWSDTWHFTLVNPALSITELYFQPQDADSEVVKIRACTAGQGGVGITMRVSVNDATDGSENGTWHIIKELGVPCFNDEDAPIWRTLEYGSGDHRVRVEAHGADVSWDGAAVRDEIYPLPHRRPPSPSLVAPVPLSGDIRDPIYLNNRTVTFKWNPALRADTYILHVGTEPSPEGIPTPVLRQTFSSGVIEYTHTFTEDHPVLYWQVTASNDKGSNTSGDQQIGIDRTAPTCTIQPLPAVSYENVFQVTWGGTDDVSGVRSYAIQYLDSERGEWIDWLRDAPSAQTYALFTGKEGHTYGFRCAATDSAGNTGDYPTVADASIKIDPTARPQTPWWDLAYANKRNITILNNMGGLALPQGYPVRVRFDSTTTPSATELYNASLSSPKCDDLRIVYNDTTQLQRVVKACSSTEIEIWFRTQIGIPAGGNNSDAHQLYYGNSSPGAPPADPNQVWYPYYESDTQYLYFFQEGSGATAYDSSGYGRHCTIDPSVAWQSSKFGSGLRFNRANYGDSYSLTCGSSALPSFTIEFWLKPDADGDGRIAGQIKNGVGLNWLLNVFEGKIRLDVWPCTTCGSSEVRSNFDLRQAPYVGNWNHIAVTFNGGNEVKFYINGALDSVKYLNQTGLTQHNIPLEIGSVEGMSQLKDNLGAFRISTGLKTSFPYGTYALITNEPATQVGAPVPPPITGNVDLRMLELSTYPNTDGGMLVQAVLRNDGTLPTQNGFFNDLYLNDVPSGPGDYTGSVRFWINEPIAAGATVTLTGVITDVTGQVYQAMSDVPYTEITGTLRVFVDSSGVLSESDENNNMDTGGTEVCIASDDLFESDDTVAEAKVLLINQAQTRNVSKLGDQDWVSFTAEAEKTYNVTTSDLGTAADTYLYLYDTDGTTLLAANDDDGNSLASHIAWTAPVSGTYYILVKHWNPNVSGCGTGYTLNLTEARPLYNIYLPLTLRVYVPPTPTYTLRLTALSGDGEIGNIECADWDACHSATTGNFLLDTFAQATVATNAYSDVFDIKRVFLSFDPSALPDNAEIVTATLSFYAGPYQHGSTRIVVVPSVHETTLRYVDFGNPLIGIVGGTAEPEPNQWVHVPLTDLMLEWIGLDETTGFALVHELDYDGVQPAEINDLVMSLSEHEGFEPYLTIQYRSATE